MTLTLSHALQDQLIAKILEKRELHHLDREFIIDKIIAYCQHNQKQCKKIIELQPEKLRKSKLVDALISFVRKEAHRMYGVYLTKDIVKAPQMIHELEKLAKKTAISAINKEKLFALHHKLLALHLSTRERLHLYPRVYHDLFAITGRPRSLLDLGCGFNGISLFYSHLTDLSYTGCEFNQKDVDLLNLYFRAIKKISTLDGKAVKINLIKHPEAVAQHPADVVFACKIFDLFPSAVVETILKQLQCMWIIASFPVKNINKRFMNAPRRAGFQKMLRRLGYTYKTVTYDTELFYIFQQHQHGATP